MKLLAGSFYYRTAATLFIGTLASSSVLVIIGWLLVGKPMVQHSAMTFAKQIQNAADTYRLVRDPQRAEFVADLHRDHEVKLEPAASSTLTGVRPHLPYFIYLEKAISQVSGQTVRLLRHGEIYSFDYPTRGMRLRFHFNENRIGAAPILALSTMTVVALLWSLLTAVLIGKYTARPIETIAQRMVTQPNALLVPIPEEGPRELREIIRNFNQITSQNRDLINKSSTMLAGISHDLRAPITRARMALELARADMDESLALRIERALIQMDTLIAQYLDYTGGSIKEGASPLSIPALLKEILQTYKHSEINLDVASEDVVYLPSRAFIRCAQNLLDNAVKHSGAAAIDVTFQKLASVWTLEIADRGPGIPDAQLDRVFQPFLRLDNARSQPGSGLGLSIVQEICRVQGWFVSLLPRPGGGLIARLTLPVAVQD